MLFSVLILVCFCFPTFLCKSLENSEEAIKNFNIPNYIKNAIEWVCDKKIAVLDRYFHFAVPGEQDSGS